MWITLVVKNKSSKLLRKINCDIMILKGKQHTHNKTCAQEGRRHAQELVRCAICGQRIWTCRWNYVSTSPLCVPYWCMGQKLGNWMNKPAEYSMGRTPQCLHTLPHNHNQARRSIAGHQNLRHRQLDKSAETPLARTHCKNARWRAKTNKNCGEGHLQCTNAWWPMHGCADKRWLVITRKIDSRQNKVEKIGTRVEK